MLEVPVTTIRHEKETKHIQFGKKEVKVSSYADNIILYMENSENCTKTTRTDEWIYQGSQTQDWHTEICWIFFFTVTIKYQKGEVKKSHLKVHQKWNI